ncbi:PAS domain S-box protein [Mucilaginibacter celer]|uniref:PAS domain S-box protein n=1 Tax=Mucilaginibacter celer TaxID=2305508 RepID=UPI0013CEB682|nr:PAS domain S-box protein [Mucilaginibacter celer]
MVVSDSFCDIFGVDENHLKQNNDFLNGLIAPETHSQIRELTQALTCGQSVVLNYSPTTNNRHLTETRRLVSDAITGNSILISEIAETQIPAQETEDIRTEQFLNSLIDSQTNFLIRIDTGGNFTFINKQFSKTFGYSKSEIIGQHFSKTTIPQELYLCEEVFANCLSNPGKIVKLIHKKPDKQGFLHDTEWEFISIVDESGKVIEVQGIGQDITVRFQAREEAMRIKNSMEALINNTEDHIWSVDREKRFVYMNQAYINQVTYLTGVEPQRGEYSYKHAGYTQQIIDDWNVYYQRALDGERYTIVNASIDPQGGRRLYFEVSFNPIYTQKGEIIGVGCLGHNITNRLKTQQELLNQNERLRNIASLSSHELRRPVASMLGLISLIDRENFFNPDNEDIIGHILTVSKEIDEVIRLIVDSTFIK